MIKYLVASYDYSV